MAGDGRFDKELPDGTRIFGEKSSEGRPGYRHGHSGDDFHRSEHSTIGSAAVDAAANNGDSGHTGKDHSTTRW